MATKKKRAARAATRRTKVIGASLDATDQERLAAYIEAEATRGVRLRPGQALGALFRRGLDAAESNS